MRTHLSDSIERKHFIIKKTDTIECSIRTIYSGTYDCRVKKKGTMHRHYHIEIMLVTSGSGYIMIENQIYKAKKGDIVFYYPNMYHCEWLGDDKDFKTLFFAIKNNKQTKELLQIAQTPYILPSKNNYIFLHNMINELIDQCQKSTKPFSNRIANCFAKIIFLKILQLSPKEPSNEQTNELYQRTKTYIDQHFTERISISNLNEVFYVSDYYISRLFKEYAGVTPGHYIIEKRMDLAKKLLLTTDLTTNEIASKVGYNDVYHFMKLFKKEVGVRPSLYRKQITF